MTIIVSRSAFRQRGSTDTMSHTNQNAKISRLDEPVAFKLEQTRRENGLNSQTKAKIILPCRDILRERIIFLMLVIDIDRNEEQKNDLG